MSSVFAATPFTSGGGTTRLQHLARKKLRLSLLNVCASEENRVRGSPRMPLASFCSSYKPVNDLMSSLNCLAYRFATAVSRSSLLSFRRVDLARLDRGSVSPCDLLHHLLHPRDPSQSQLHFICEYSQLSMYFVDPVFMSGLSPLLQVASTVRLVSLSWLSRPLSSDVKKVPLVFAKVVSSLYRAPCRIASNRLHMNLNRTEARQKASIMFASPRCALSVLGRWASSRSCGFRDN